MTEPRPCGGCASTGALPPQATTPHRAMRVACVVPEGRAGVTLVMDGAFAARPGQFVMAWLPRVEERPFSIMDDDPLSLTVARVGPFTRAMSDLQVGDRLWVRGPYGYGFSLLGRHHLLVGGGSGAASLALLAKVALHRGDDVVVAIGARTGELLMLPWRYRELDCEPLLATDDGTAGHHGTVLSAVERLLVERWPDTIYACGPEAMLRAVAQCATALGIPCQVSLERAMKCGLGVCGTCHLHDRLVCADGPVFDGAWFANLPPTS